MRVCLLPLTIATVAIGCSVTPIRKDRPLSKDVVVANSMCAQHGVVSASNDPVGDRMVCGWEEFVGSHVPKCVCRDEQQVAEDRESSQEWIRVNEHGRCISNGGGTCN